MKGTMDLEGGAKKRRWGEEGGENIGMEMAGEEKEVKWD